MAPGVVFVAIHKCESGRILIAEKFPQRAKAMVFVPDSPRYLLLEGTFADNGGAVIEIIPRPKLPSPLLEYPELGFAAT